MSEPTNNDPPSQEDQKQLKTPQAQRKASAKWNKANKEKRKIYNKRYYEKKKKEREEMSAKSSEEQEK